MANKIFRTSHRFFDWWISELRACLPQMFHAYVFGFQSTTVLRSDSKEFHLEQRAGEKVLPLRSVSRSSLENPDLLGQIRKLILNRDLDNKTVQVELSSDEVVFTTIELPLEAGENLEEVVRQEIDRFSPFTSDQAYYDFAVAGSDLERRRLNVSVLVIPKHHATPALDFASLIGLKISSLSGSGLASTKQGYNALPSTERQSVRNIAGRVSAFLACLAVGLLALSLLLSFERSKNELAKSNELLERLRSEASIVSNLKGQIRSLELADSFAADAKSTRHSVLQLLKEVTTELPDHTWLSQFVLQGKVIRLSGFSKSPSILVGILESSPLFANVRFSSPVTRDTGSSFKKFSLTAEVTSKSDK